MKNGLKYLIAILIAGSLGIWFIPLLNISIVQMSLMDVMKIGLGFYGGSTEAELIYGSIQTYLSTFAWGIAAAALFVLIEAFFTAVLGKRKGYIVSLVSSIVNAVAGGAAFLMLWLRVEEVKKATILILTGDAVNVNFIPLVVWIGIYILIFILSIVGINLWSSAKSDKQEEIYIEQINRLKQTERPVSEPPVRQFDEGVQRRGGQQKEPVRKIYRGEEYRAMPEKSQKNIGQGYSEKDNVEIENFSGALLGTTGLFSGKAYPLENETEVFFREEDGNVFVIPYEKVDNLAGVYYIGQYQEYCVEPFGKMTFFLESGQPLGKGRKYYLPRGTKVYLRDKRNQFTLA